MVYWWIPTHGEENAKKMERTIRALKREGVLPKMQSFKATQDYKNSWGVQIVFKEKRNVNPEWKCVGKATVQYDLFAGKDGRYKIKMWSIVDAYVIDEDAGYMPPTPPLKWGVKFPQLKTIQAFFNEDALILMEES